MHFCELAHELCTRTCMQHFPCTAAMPRSQAEGSPAKRAFVQTSTFQYTTARQGKVLANRLDSKRQARILGSRTRSLGSSHVQGKHRLTGRLLCRQAGNGRLQCGDAVMDVKLCSRSHAKSFHTSKAEQRLICHMMACDLAQRQRPTSFMAAAAPRQDQSRPHHIPKLHKHTG